MTNGNPSSLTAGRVFHALEVPFFVLFVRKTP